MIGQLLGKQDTGEEKLTNKTKGSKTGHKAHKTQDQQNKTGTDKHRETRHTWGHDWEKQKGITKDDNE